MHYVKQFHINGVDTKQVACIELHGKPNAATEGYVGVLGMDMDSPLHEVYKCVAVNGSIYSWELLSSGMSVISSTITKDGADRAEFPYDTLRTPAMYVVKVGDLILDREAYLYQIVSMHSTFCTAEYCEVQGFKGAPGEKGDPGKTAYQYAVDGGYAGTEADFIAELNYLSGLKANAQQQFDGKADIGEKISDASVAHVKSVPANAAPYAKVLEIGGMTRTSTNLLPLNFSSQTIGGVSFTVNDGIITAKGTSTGEVFYRKIATATLDPGTYTFSGVELWSGSNIRLDLETDGTDVDPGDGVYVTSTTSGPAECFTISTQMNVSLYLTVDTGDVDDTIKPMINKGNTVVGEEEGSPVNTLPYEPYFEGLRSAPVTAVESMGANLYSGGDLSFTQSTTVTLAKPLEAGTYTIGCVCTSTVANESPIATFIGDSGNMSVSFSRKSRDTVTVTLPSRTSQIRFCASSSYTASAGYSATYTDIMINKGSTALPYTPYLHRTISIPASVQALEGYGLGINSSMYNYINYETKQFVKRVAKVDMGTLNWSYSSGVKTLYAKLSGIKAKGVTLCVDYTSVTDAAVFGTTDKAVYLGNVVTSGAVNVRDSAYTDASAFKTAMAGVMLYYELATPEVTGISNLLSTDNLLPVEGGGTVTFVNEYGYAVPSEVVFYENRNELVGAKQFIGELVGTAQRANRAEMDALGNPIDSYYYPRCAKLIDNTYDLNTLYTPGVYRYVTGTSPANAPFDGYAAFVEVFGDNYSVIQRVQRYGVAGSVCQRRVRTDGNVDIGAWGYFVMSTSPVAPTAE